MKDIHSEISRLAERHRLADVYAFGSRAKEIVVLLHEGEAGRSSASSDVDIGVRPLSGVRLSPREIVNIAIELEDLLEVNRVDLVVLPQAEPFLALDIVKGETLYTRDPIDQARYELLVFRRASDLLPLKKERIEMILGGANR